VPITVFLRALAVVDDGLYDSPLNKGTDEEILELFKDVDNNPEHEYIRASFEEEPQYDLNSGLDIAQAALIELFKNCALANRQRWITPATILSSKSSIHATMTWKSGAL